MFRKISEPHTWFDSRQAKRDIEHSHVEYDRYNSKTQDPLLIPSYSPDAKLNTQKQEDSEISEMSSTKLKAMVALPYTYDGKPAEIVVVKHASDTGIEAANNE